MKPTIGRIVHYQAFGTPGGEYKAEPRAAVVTAVGVTIESTRDGVVHSETTLSLCVLNPTGMFFNASVSEDASAEPRGGTWHWPPREPTT